MIQSDSIDPGFEARPSTESTETAKHPNEDSLREILSPRRVTTHPETESIHHRRVPSVDLVESGFVAVPVAFHQIHVGIRRKRGSNGLR